MKINITYLLSSCLSVCLDQGCTIQNLWWAYKKVLRRSEGVCILKTPEIQKLWGSTLSICRPHLACLLDWKCFFYIRKTQVIYTSSGLQNQSFLKEMLILFLFWSFSRVYTSNSTFPLIKQRRIFNSYFPLQHQQMICACKFPCWNKSTI